MNSSAKIVYKRSADPVDRLIYEKGLRASYLVIDKKLDLLLVVLNNGKVLRDKISSYLRLKSASQKQLDAWELIGKGVAIHWEELDEDISIKGMIKSTALDQAISMLQEKKKFDLLRSQILNLITPTVT